MMVNAPKSISRKKSDVKKTILADFNFSKELIPADIDSQLRSYREKAWDAFESFPFPTMREEPWRRTDIRGLDTRAFRFSKAGRILSEPPERFLLPVTGDDEKAGQIISGAGTYNLQLSPELADQGVIFTDFGSAEKDHSKLLDRLLGQVVAPTEDKFTALAAALAEDGVLLYVPKNVVIDQPLHSLYWGDGENRAFLNHLVIWLEEGAQVTFVHESASPDSKGNAQLLHTGIVEIYVGQNAKLHFVELQSWGDNVWSFTRERARVMGNGHLEWIFGAMGTHLTKNFSDIDLMEPGAMGRMSGFYFANKDQHLDHDTQQNHLAPNTTSDLLYKGALMDHSRSVWQGMIYVAPGAIGTDGYQANRNLILSKGARADSIPGLEILADDVRCTHGATVGKLDENLLFYLESRGIPRKDAEELIVMGFFAPIMERIPFDGVRTRFAEAVQEKMSQR